MQRSIAAVLVILFLAVVPSSLRAQDKIDIYTGYSYVRPPVSVVEQVVYCPVEGQCPVPSTIFINRENLFGWEASAGHHFGANFSLVADGSGDYGKATSGFPTNARAHQYTFLGGPQFSRTSRFSPFVHVLAGATHQSVDASGNSFFTTFPGQKWGVAAAIGGGIDLKIAPIFSFRLIQADYLLTHFNGSFQSQPRLSGGLIVRF